MSLLPILFPSEFRLSLRFSQFNHSLFIFCLFLSPALYALPYFTNSFFSLSFFLSLLPASILYSQLINSSNIPPFSLCFPLPLSLYEHFLDFPSFTNLHISPPFPPHLNVFTLFLFFETHSLFISSSFLSPSQSLSSLFP